METLYNIKFGGYDFSVVSENQEYKTIKTDHDFVNKIKLFNKIVLNDKFCLKKINYISSELIKFKFYYKKGLINSFLKTNFNQEQIDKIDRKFYYFLLSKN